MTTNEIEVLKRILEEARTIANLKNEERLELTNGFAYSLGRANGLAKYAIIPRLETLIAGGAL